MNTKGTLCPPRLWIQGKAMMSSATYTYELCPPRLWIQGKAQDG